MPQLQCHSPIDGHLVFETPLHSDTQIGAILDSASSAQKAWAKTPLSARIKILRDASNSLYKARHELGFELAVQMGRPVAFAKFELQSLKERSDAMLNLAPEALADVRPEPLETFERRIAREPVGVVAVLAPWNYPYLTSVNTIIPALAAGNSVILKHAAQTPLVAKRYQEAFDAAGLPAGVFQHVFLDHEKTARLIGNDTIDFVAFTGSVDGGHAICQAIAHRFIGAGLELGGKDPAYVRADADVAYSAAQLADGAFFNSGQSCCGIERIYVHESLFDTFVENLTDEAGKLVLGDPRSPETTLGPMASARGADAVRAQISEALEAGARNHLDIDSNAGSPFMKPQVLTQVNHQMSVMKDESFGPVVGVMAVKDDAEAIRLMNDSNFGLTASIWTCDYDAVAAIGDQLETGTVFVNRCDYLDPDLAWTGVKDSGRGCSLSRLGYEQLTRPKSFHFRLWPEK